ncbi:hypothetical protein XENORESO_016680 [Xenotaenia resolanae]|uniref:Uncharacterized protein n=1 Tax=Xenotaenia resolanae TaxID=208358 RepID=A0ABV0XAF2_9TELE
MSPPSYPKTKALHANNRKRRTKSGKTNKSSRTNATHTHAHICTGMPDGTQSASKSDRPATETRLIQMTSKLCCHIREKKQPPYRFSWWLQSSLRFFPKS